MESPLLAWGLGWADPPESPSLERTPAKAGEADGGWRAESRMITTQKLSDRFFESSCLGCLAYIVNRFFLRQLASE